MLMLIALIAIIPFLLAWFYARNPGLIAKKSNYGTLIVPARPLLYEDLLVALDSRPVPLQEAKGRWIMLQVLMADSCGSACRATLHASRQIRLLLNKDITRVRRLLLIGDFALPFAGDAKDDADLLYGKATLSITDTLTRILGQAPEEGTLILIDPFANAMMWYPPGFDWYGVLRDLKHLLRSSQIG